MEIKVMHQIMEWNEDVSDAVKAELAAHKVCLINVMGSPGAGKTTTLISLINRLRDRYRIGVIEGDIAGQIDADTIHALGLPVTQIDTDGACHIEAMSIQKMLPDPPMQMAPATPTRFPVPTVAPRAVQRLRKELFSFPMHIARNPAKASGSSRSCTNPVRTVRYRPTPRIPTKAGRPHTKPLILSSISSIFPPIILMMHR